MTIIRLGNLEEDALKCVTSLFQQYNCAILVGGSGMYVDAVCSGIDEIPSNSSVRAQLNKNLMSTEFFHYKKSLNKKIQHILRVWIFKIQIDWYAHLRSVGILEIRILATEKINQKKDHFQYWKLVCTLIKRNYTKIFPIELILCWIKDY